MNYSKKRVAVFLAMILITANLSVSYISLEAAGAETVSVDKVAGQERSSADAQENGDRADPRGSLEASDTDAKDAEDAEAEEADYTAGNSAEDAPGEAAADTGDKAVEEIPEDSADKTAGDVDLDAAEDTEEAGGMNSVDEETDVRGDDSGSEASVPASDDASVSDDQVSGDDYCHDGNDSDSDVSGPSSGPEQADIAEEAQSAGEAEAPAADSAQEAQGTQEDPAEYPVITEDPPEETVVPAGDFWPDIDDDAIFAGYVNREMELTGDLRMEDGNISSSAKRSSKAYVSSRLTGTNKIIYDLMVEEIRKVAGGQRTDTIFCFSTEDLGVADQFWSASELGVDVIVVNGAISKEAMDALSARLDVSFRLINRALLSDCPYDLYWYDKTYGSDSSGFGYSAIYEDGEYKLGFSSKYEYTFCFPVSKEYSVDNTEGTYEVNTEIGASVRTAHETALSIVDMYSGCTDYEKLVYYKDEICDLTSYNRTAASNPDTPYGNPWQLIWVFDGDNNTAVVCEGYSKAFQYLCDLSSWNGLFEDCISVTGSLVRKNGSEGHMWNIVTLQDGRNYLVDVTNCDDGSFGSGNGRSNLFLVGTGDASSGTVYAQGSLEDGYSFTIGSTTLTFMYDDNTLECFGTEILTLSGGRINSAPEVDLAAAYEEGTAAVTLTLPEEGLVYTGNEQTPPVTVTYNGSTLTEQVDYKLTYTDGENASRAVNAGDALVRITGIGSCTGTIEIPFVIAKARQTITANDVAITAFSSRTLSVRGNSTALTFTSGDTSVFTVNAGTGLITAVAPGSAKLIITAEETPNYEGASLQIKVSVSAIDLNVSGTSVTLSAVSYTYDGTPKTPSVTRVVDAKGRVLTAGTDYTVSYSTNINAGNNTAKVFITGKGCYTGVIRKSFTINRAAQPLTVKAGASVIAVGKSASYTVSGAKGTLSFRSLSTATATVSKNGDVSYKVTGVKVGKTTITITAEGTSNYLAASRTVKVSIVPGATAKLTVANQGNGISLSWAKTTGANGYCIYRNNTLIKTITSGSTVSFIDTKATADGTKYEYKVFAKAETGMSPLCRTVSIYRLSRPAIRELKNKATRKLDVSWYRNPRATGWQIQYSQNGNFSASGSVTIPGNSTVTKTLLWLTRNRNYYVRIRTYKKVGSHVSYSAWSSCRTVRIMK